MGNRGTETTRRLGGWIVGCATALALVGCAGDEAGRGGGRGLGDDARIRALDDGLELREGVVDLPMAGEVEILYAVIDDRAIWTGDVVLGDPDELDSGFRAASLTTSLWPNGTVKYVIDASLPASYKANLSAAMQTWTDRAGVRFVEASPQEQDVGGFVQIKGDEDGCWAHMGAPSDGEYHELNLGTDCDLLSTHLHELGHVLGLFHEQSRADRDEHVTIHWDNIQPGSASAFDQYTKSGEAGMDRGGYDYDSVMHYGSDAFAVDANKPAIARKDGSLIPWSENLSAGDVAAVSAMYAGQANQQDNAADDPDGEPNAAAPGSCSGQCGSDQAVPTDDGQGCYCDAGCAEYGDCCADKDTVCGAGPDTADAPAQPAAPSCAGQCGSSTPQSDAAGKNCYCDEACSANGDCCSDHAAACGDDGAGDGSGDGAGDGSAGSCIGHCGGTGSQGESCYCDDQCSANGDCCSDFAAACGDTGGDDGGAGPSCAGQCGSETAVDGCHCDPSCVQYQDCCPDYATVCG